MRRDQLSASKHQHQIPPGPTTMWHQLPASSQQQLAHLVAQLIQRIRQAAPDKEQSYER
jgi:hypothetical protein